MNLKRILLVVLVAVVVIGSTAFLLNYDETVKYTTYNLSKTCMMDLPSGDNYENTTVNEAIRQINDTNRDLTVLFYNSEDNSTVARVEFEFTINDFKATATEQTVANRTVWYNEENGTYMAFLGNSVTHDNIIIITNDVEILEHLISSVKFIFLNEDGTVNSTSDMVNNQSINVTGGTASNGTDASASTATSNVSSSNSQSTGNDGYYWSGQDQDYIKEYTDSNGIQHIDRRNGPNEAYDPNTQRHYTDGVEDTAAYNQDFN
ncbi:hypothetical protein [Methanobrevibacter ruminantium]|nr:hypothetical protein [Methanobrevibacter ruminantium]